MHIKKILNLTSFFLILFNLIEFDSVYALCCGRSRDKCKNGDFTSGRAKYPKTDAEKIQRVSENQCIHKDSYKTGEITAWYKVSCDCGEDCSYIDDCFSCHSFDFGVPDIEVTRISIKRLIDEKIEGLKQRDKALKLDDLSNLYGGIINGPLSSVNNDEIWSWITELAINKLTEIKNNEVDNKITGKTVSTTLLQQLGFDPNFDPRKLGESMNKCLNEGYSCNLPGGQCNSDSGGCNKVLSDCEIGNSNCPKVLLQTCDVQLKEMNDEINNIIKQWMRLQSTRKYLATRWEPKEELTPEYVSKNSIVFPQTGVPLASVRLLKKGDSNNRRPILETPCTKSREECDIEEAREYLKYIFEKSVRIKLAGTEQLKLDWNENVEPRTRGFYHGVLPNLSPELLFQDGSLVGRNTKSDTTAASCSKGGVANYSNRYSKWFRKSFGGEPYLESVVERKISSMVCNNVATTQSETLSYARGDLVELGMLLMENMKSHISSGILWDVTSHPLRPIDFGTRSCGSIKEQIKASRNHLKNQYDELKSAFGASVSSLSCAEALLVSKGEKNAEKNSCSKLQVVNQQHTVCNLETKQIEIEFIHSLEYLLCMWDTIFMIIHDEYLKAV